MSGTLFGVGVGPGAPDLLTLRAARIIERVPIICVPSRTTGGNSYALGVVESLVRLERQQVVELSFPMTRDSDQARQARDVAAAQVLTLLAGGRDVAFLTEGDPLFYSTFIYLSRGLRASLASVCIEAVPGVSSIHAAAAAAALPLAEGGETLAVVPASYEPDRLRRVLTEFDNVVLLKVHAVWARVLALLEDLGLAAQAVVVSRAGAPEQRVYWDAGALRGQPPEYFSLVLVKRSLEARP